MIESGPAIFPPGHPLTHHTNRPPAPATAQAQARSTHAARARQAKALLDMGIRARSRATAALSADALPFRRPGRASGRPVGRYEAHPHAPHSAPAAARCVGLPGCGVSHGHPLTSRHTDNSPGHPPPHGPGVPGRMASRRPQPPPGYDKPRPSPNWNAAVPPWPCRYGAGPPGGTLTRLHPDTLAPSPSRLYLVERP